jgi:protein-S-isoprenylcysteine O-methyltransferase Ste14
MTFVDAIDAAAKLLLFGWFSYVLQTHFSSSGKEPLGMTLIKVCSVVGLVVCFWMFSIQGDRYWYSLVGLFTTFLSAVIFYLAVQASKAAGLHVAFSESTGKSLVASGIYRYVRHPLYLSYILYWLSWSASLKFVFPSIAVFVVLLTLYILSIRLEERELEQKFGDEHREYRERTALLLPYVW